MPSKKKPLLIAAIVVVVILIALIAAPFFIDVNGFRPQIEQALGAAIGRQVRIGALHASLWKGSLVADDISIADDPAFGQAPFLTAKSLSVGVDVMPLVLSRELHVHSFTFENPRVQLLRTAQGDWNFASLGGTKKTPSQPAANPANPSSGPALKSFSVDKMAIGNGTIALGRAGQPSRLAYEDANIAASNVSTSTAFPFRFDAKTPSGGKLGLQAQVGPLGTGNANTLPFQGQMKAVDVPAADIQDLLSVLGYSLPQGASLKGGTIQADLEFHGPLNQVVTSGPVKLTNVTLAGFSLASKLAGALGQAGGAVGNDTMIQLASSTMQYAPQGVRADNLQIVIPLIGSLTGAGSVSASNNLNFRLVAKLGGSSPLAQLVKLPLLAQNGGGLPFRIQGTTSHPVVVPEVGGIVKGLVGSQLNQLGKTQQNGGGIAGILGGLLGKKKKQP